MLKSSRWYRRARPWILLGYGSATFVPFVPPDLLWRSTGGTVSARYCYAVWMRHLVRAAAAGLREVPACVAELGPGDSLGLGVAALLSGARRYLALDVVPHGDLARTAALIDELVGLFAARAPIPGPDEFPDVHPRLADHRFPSALIGDDRLQAALQPARIQALRDALLAPRPGQDLLRYVVPWQSAATVEPASVDFLFSQAVLEHVDDVAGAYAAMQRWLRPGALCSHQIDFQSHGITEAWDGHRAYTDLRWRLLRGRRPYLINRLPASAHLRQLREAGLEVLVAEPVQRAPELPRAALAARFRGLDEADRRTAGLFVVARRPA